MASEAADFCDNYVIIEPEEASWFDLVKILCSNHVEKRGFLKCPVGGTVAGFRYRWIVFISVLLQKVFLGLKKPMEAAGAAVELCLNYPPCNGGYRNLVVNLLTGKLVNPDKSSATFASIVGHLDKRWDLDTTYQTASLAIMASKLSYENSAFAQNVVTHRWQMEFLGFYNFWNDYQELRETNAIMFRDKNRDPNLIVVAFRGTEPLDTDAWRTDVDISWYEFHGVGKIHGGFLKALGLQKHTGWPKQISDQRPFAYYTIRDRLKSMIHDNPDAKFVLTGHSLGGALAVLFAAVLAMHGEETLLRRLEGVYSFGQPRVGDGQFGDFMKRKTAAYGVKYSRYVYCNDIVTRLPYDDDTFLFKHFGPCLYFDSRYRGRLLDEDPNKNYFSLVCVVPKILIAIYELIRSFVLPWTEGGEYKEEWLMRFFRVTALVFPGLTEHIPTDYVNVTRLGTMSSSSLGPGQNLKNH